MKKLSLFLTAISIFLQSINLISPAPVSAQNTSPLIFVDIKVGPSSDEFIRIFNNSSSTIDFTSYKLQYRSANSSSWSNKNLTVLNKSLSTLAPNSFILLTSTGYTGNKDISYASFASGLSDAGGSLKLQHITSPDTFEVFSWGLSDPPACTLAPPNLESQSIRRFVTPEGQFSSYSTSGLDFYVTYSLNTNYQFNSPTNLYTEVSNLCNKPAQDICDDNLDNNFNSKIDENCNEICENNLDDNLNGEVDENCIDIPITTLPAIEILPIKTSTSSTEEDEKVYPVIQITELFPDPTAPLTDANDEYIELYNPNENIVNLNQYTLQTGINNNISFKIPSILLQPKSYFAISRKDSGLSLANTTSKAQLKDPAGNIIDITPTYEDSTPGLSLQRFTDSWQWSNPTPSEPNIIEVISESITNSTIKPVIEVVQKSSNLSKSKKSSAKTLTESLVGSTKAVDASKITGASTKSTSSKKSSSSTTNPSINSSNINPAPSASVDSPSTGNQKIIKNINNSYLIYGLIAIFITSYLALEYFESIKSLVSKYKLRSNLKKSQRSQFAPLTK